MSLGTDGDPGSEKHQTHHEFLQLFFSWYAINTVSVHFRVSILCRWSQTLILLQTVEFVTLRIYPVSKTTSTLRTPPPSDEQHAVTYDCIAH